MERTLPKISIIMPVLNRIDTIQKAFDSVFAQQYDNLELIVIDGGSTDGTVDIIQRNAQHIHYWQSKPDKTTSCQVIFIKNAATFRGPIPDYIICEKEKN